MILPGRVTLLYSTAGETFVSAAVSTKATKATVNRTLIATDVAHPSAETVVITRWVASPVKDVS